MSQTERHASVAPERGAPPADAPQEIQQYLTFLLGGETFALNIQAVKEILQYAAPTSVPMMPDSVRGVINLRGSVVPVMDLAVRFGRPACVVGRRTCIVIVEMVVEGAIQRFGVLADAASEVLELAADAIEPVPEFGVRIDSRFVCGLGKVAGKFVVILEASRLCLLDEMGALAGAATEEN
ncbi:MAG: chemotaxis protein CheW [Gammaproteobacteria bacterium]